MSGVSKLRVALDGHVIGHRMTGNETYVANLAMALARRDDVDPLVYLDRGVEWSGVQPSAVRRLRLRRSFLRIPLELPYRAAVDRADLLHVQYVAPPIGRVPVVVTVHDVSFEDVPGLFSGRTQLRLKLSIRATVRRAAAIITISQFTRDRLAFHYGLDPDRIHVTPLGVDPRWVRLQDESVAPLLSPLRLPSRFVLAVGNLHPRKNLPRLVRAVHAARIAGLHDLHLVIAGQRLWRSSVVNSTVADVRGEAWTHFTGFVSDDILQALYSRALVVAYPSLYEGFGLPVLEALACGAVVLSSNAAALPEVAGGAALLVDPRSDENLRDALIRLVSDDRLRAELQAAGPVRARAFTWERCAEQTMLAYRAAVGTSPV